MRHPLPDIVTVFAEAVRPVADVLACYVGGSLASGDYRPGVSDMDLAAVVRGDPDESRLTSLHQGLVGAELLHCAYLPADDLGDLSREHLVWAHGELYRRPFGGIARAELHTFGITVYGPPPGQLLSPVDAATLDAAARDELSGYWTRAAGKPGLWRQATFVDHGLTTLARARATITDGRLITKREAIDSLEALGVPAYLVRQIRRRRDGEEVAVAPDDGELSRRIMIELMAQTLALP